MLQQVLVQVFRREFFNFWSGTKETELGVGRARRQKGEGSEGECGCAKEHRSGLHSEVAEKDHGLH